MGWGALKYSEHLVLSGLSWAFWQNLFFKKVADFEQNAEFWQISGRFLADFQCSTCSGCSAEGAEART